MSLTYTDPLQNFPARAKVPTLADWVVSSVLIVVVTAAVWLLSDIHHWMVLPVGICGLLITPDAVAWVRGRVDPFDPAGIIGLLGVHMFFVAPLLHAGWNAWMGYVTPLPDWKDWVGWMAIINAIGLILYRLGRGVVMIRPARLKANVRLPAPGRWGMLLGLGMILTLATQVYIYHSFGGINGYINAYQREQYQFVGLGPVFAISESFPTLCLIGYVVFCHYRGRVPSWIELIVFFALFVGLKILFGGLRGSRSNTIFGMFWTAGIVHFMLRRLRRAMIYAGIVVLVLFLYIWGFYKAGGIRGLYVAFDPTMRSDTNQAFASRTYRGLLLGDFARADVQAYVLRQTTSAYSGYRLAWGKTFVGSAAMLIPKQVWQDKPPPKSYYGTLALFGDAGSDIHASNVYGLAGEWMLNFGAPGALVSFLLFGLVVGLVRKYMSSVPIGDLRWVLIPFIINVCLALLLDDSDNVVFLLVKDGAVPLLIVYLGSRLIPRAQAEAYAHVEEHADAGSSNGMEVGGRYAVSYE